MKHLFFAVCLLHSANACAMGVGRVTTAIILGTTPITIPAFMLYPRKKVELSVGPSMTNEKEEERIKEEYEKASKQFESFTSYVWLGAWPVINIRAFNSVMKLRRDGNSVDGFFNGLSLYAMIPVALQLLKRVK